MLHNFVLPDWPYFTVCILFQSLTLWTFWGLLQGYRRLHKMNDQLLDECVKLTVERETTFLQMQKTIAHIFERLEELENPTDGADANVNVKRPLLSLSNGMPILLSSEVIDGVEVYRDLDK